MSVEIVITVRDDERTNRTRHLVYEPVTFGILTDPIIKDLVDKAIEEFEGEPEDVIIKGTMIWR